MQNYNREMTHSIEIDNIQHQPDVKIVSRRSSASGDTHSLPNSKEVGNANHKSVKQTPLHSSSPIALQSQRNHTLQAQNFQTSNSASPPQPAIPPRDLTKPRSEWVHDDFVFLCRSSMKVLMSGR